MLVLHISASSLNIVILENETVRVNFGNYKLLMCFSFMTNMASSQDFMASRQDFILAFYYSVDSIDLHRIWLFGVNSGRKQFAEMALPSAPLFLWLNFFFFFLKSSCVSLPKYGQILDCSDILQSMLNLSEMLRGFAPLESF